MTKAKTVQNRNKVKTETRGLKTLQKIKFIIESLTWIPGQPTKATKRVNPKKKPNLKQFKILWARFHFFRFQQKYFPLPDCCKY